MHPTDPPPPPPPPAATSTSRPPVDRRAKSSPSLHRSTSTTAIHSTSFALRRSRSKHLRSQTSVDSLPDMISPEEYAALPASIQKKYFSSKERLCIAQQSAAHGRKKQHGKLGSWLSSTSTSDLLSDRPSTSGGLHSLKPKARTHDPKLSLVQFDDDSVSEEEARWFLSLPEKVKTTSFSREELVSLTAKAHRVLRKSSTDAGLEKAQRRQSVHRLESGPFVPIPSEFSSSTASKITDCDTQLPSEAVAENGTALDAETDRTSTDATEASKIQPDLKNGLPLQSSQAAGTAVHASDAEMELLKLYLQRRSLKPKLSASRFKRSPDSPPTTTPQQPTKHRSHQRLPVLTPLPLPPPVLAPAPRPTGSTPFSTSARLSRPFLNDDPLALEDEPEADTSSLNRRDVEGTKDLPALALQVESEIFELPANEEPKRVAMDEDCPYPHLVSAFSDDDSDEDDGEDDDDNVDTDSVETIGPRTPSPMDHRDAAVQQAAGDPGIDIPDIQLDFRPKTSSALERTSSWYSNHDFSHNSTGSLPAVLRTSSEDMLYAFQRRLTSGVEIETTDPLALESLPICDDETGAHGAFAVPRVRSDGTLGSSKGFKKVFKSLKRL